MHSLSMTAWQEVLIIGSSNSGCDTYYGAADTCTSAEELT